MKVLVIVAIAVAAILSTPFLIQVARPPTPVAALVSPTFARDYAEALCRGDAAYLAKETEIPGIGEEAISYFLFGYPTCTQVVYVGQFTDSGNARYIFVLSYETGRADFFVLTFNTDAKLTTLNYG